MLDAKRECHHLCYAATTHRRDLVYACNPIPKACPTQLPRQHDDDLHGLEGVTDRFRRPEERRATLMVTPTTVQLLQLGLDLKHDSGTDLV